MAVRKTFAWVVFLLLVAGGVGGAYVYSILQRTNELLEEQVLKALHEKAPNWDLELGSARFDFDGKIRLYDLVLRTSADLPPLVTIPEVVVTVDRDQLAEQRILIHHVQLLQPQVTLIRHSTGKWNWEDLPPLPAAEDGPIPECKILQGKVSLQLAPEDADSRGLVLREVDLRIVPLGKRQLQALGVTTVDQAGRLSLEGECDLDKSTWTVKGSISRLKAGADLVGMVAGISPEVRENLDRLFAKLQETAESPTSVMDAAPSIEAVMDVHFRVSQWQAGGVQEYKVLMNLLSGTASHPRLPFALQDLKGKVYCDNRQLLIQTLTARNGRTQLLADGRLVRQEHANPGTIAVRIRDLPLDQRLRDRLPEKIQEQFDAIRPAGQVDANFDLTYDGLAQWSCVSEIIAKECTAAHEKFPYLIEKVQGTLLHAGDLMEISMQGLAGTRPVTLAGRIRMGEAPRSDFVMRASGIPLDQRFLDAAPPPMRSTLQQMNVKGTADLVYQMTKVGRGDIPFQTRLKGQLRGCTMVYSGFPYEVEQLSGKVEFDGTNWIFQEIQGVHGNGILKGEGTYVKEAETGLLDLRVNVSQGTLDLSLKNALSESWQGTWDELSPTGKVDVASRVLWSPGQPPRIQLSADISGGSISLRSFPYPLDDVTAKLSMVGNRVDITSFSGSHEETQVQMAGWATIAPDGEWRVRIEKMNVDDLEPNRRFRRALPSGFREVVENLDPRQAPVSISGMLEFRGTGDPEDDVTAAWDIETIYAGATLTAGVDLEKLYGRAISRGTWDGERVVSSGRLQFDSVSINGYQFTDVAGPFQINGNQLVIGSKEMVNVTGADRNALRIPTENRMTAEAIDGLFTLDGIAVLDDMTSYRVLITMNGTKLERYAKLYMPPGRNTLQGVMNGWVELSGRGSSAQRVNGRGQLQVSPAALYELPVMVAIFKILSFGTPDKTAFDHAFVQFDVTGGQYILRQIDLIGDAISFRGHGYVRFDGRLSLDFYSRVARNQLPIPLVQNLLGEATKGWFGVEVRGTTSEPIATLKPVPRLDDALKGFLGVFDQRAQPPRPPSFIPDFTRRQR